MIGPLLFLCLVSGIVLLAVGLSGKQAAVAARVAGWGRGARSSALVAPAVLLAACGCGFLAGVIAWTISGIPVLGLGGALAGGYAPFVWARRRREQALRDREQAWPAVLAQLADALETGIAFPAAVGLIGETGPEPLRRDFARFHSRLRSEGLAEALDSLARSGERTAATVVLLLRAGLVELPAGGLAPLLRELSVMLRERFEVREKARVRASSLQAEAAILAVSPIALLLLVGAASPEYLAAYRTATGTAVAAAGGLVIFGCYLLMRRLGQVPEPHRKQGSR